MKQKSKNKSYNISFLIYVQFLGVSEGDDLRLLFNTKRFNYISLDSPDAEVSQKLIKLWVSFAKEG